MKILILTATLVFTLNSEAQSFVTLEGAAAWQSQNDQRIPGDSGTRFSFSDFKTGPFPAYRVYAGHLFNQTHEVCALYAPLELDLNGQFDKAIVFQDSTFAANTETKGHYKFNSYRLTYAYHFPSAGDWKFALGFTGKIRDAEVSLSQGALKQKKTNVGFVPLLNFQASRVLTDRLTFRFDFDGLAAPQGRAFDIGLFLEHDLQTHGLSTFAGYRNVEGGADNKKVYNFAWIHYATLGLKGSF